MAYKQIRKRGFSDMDEENFPEEKNIQDFNSEAPAKGGSGKLIVVLAVILVLALGGWAVARYSSFNFWGLLSQKGSGAATSDWQAVFLSNGQVYFGKIKKTDQDSIVLADIYYLQVVNKPLQRTQEGQETAAGQTEQQLTLIKLGNELHGPVDEMVINRDHVLLTEKLKNDSRVVDAINRYVESQKQPQQ